MASGIRPSKDEHHRPKAPLTKTTSLTVGVKPKPRVCATKSTAAGASRGVSALMLREMEDLRNLSIGSPVPTPQTDDDDDGVFERVFDDETFPAIRIDRCATTVDAGMDRGPSAKRSDDHTRNGRPREDVATTNGGTAARPPASNRAKSEQRSD